MPQTASERVAQQLAERSAAKGAPAPAAEADEPGDEAGQDEEEAPARPMSLKEKQAARKSAANPKGVSPLKAEAEPEPDDDEEDEEPVVEAPKAAAKAATKPKAGAGTSPGKKKFSPAQLAAQERFAEASRARAAEKRGEPVVTPPTKSVVSRAKGPVQTEDQVKAAQNAARKQTREDAAAAVAPKRAPTSHPVKAQETKAQAASRARREKAEAKPILKVSKKVAPPRDLKASDSKAKAPAAKAERAPRGNSDTKAKIHALLDKGKTRQQIMAALDLSYPTVSYHAKSYTGGITTSRGSIFVKIGLDEEGQKLGKGKSEEVSRSEAMRREWKGGMKVGDIARKYLVRYQIAYTAIRPLLSDGDE